MRIAVFGTGLVGSAIVRDLASDPGMIIRAVDLDRSALATLQGKPGIEAIRADIREPGRIESLVADCDLVISAVPGFMGFQTLKEILEVGRSVVDISFFPEDPFLLEDLAREKGVAAVVDCGVAPGLCNILAGHMENLLDQIDRYACYVGGLPLRREWPFEYKAVFSPSDVLEEYTRPVYLVEYGQEVVRPALSDVELRDFQEIGTLEAFNTDGLRTLRRTLKAPFMKEKTMRYPGHAHQMRILRECGFFGTAPVDIDGQPVVPLRLTSALLFNKWRLDPGEHDLTVMQVLLEGKKGAKCYRYTYNLLDRYDRETQTTSMARTTGYTCTIVARQLIKGLFTGKGICPPEFVGRRRNCFDDLISEFGKRSIRIEERIEEI